MNLPHLFIVLVIIFDVVRNEAFAFEISSLRELILNLDNTAASFTDLFDLVLNFNTKVDDLYKFLKQAKKDLNQPTPAFSIAFGYFFRTYRDMETIPFEMTRVNINDCYNTKSGVFKAPVTGIYYLSLTVTQFCESGANKVEIVAGDDKRILGHIYINPENNVEPRILYILAHLNAEEEVWIRCAHDLCDFIFGSHTTFSGFLLKI